MIETDATGCPVRVEDLDPDWLLSLAEHTETQSRRADRSKLRLAAHWCVLHPATADTGPATWADACVPEVLGCDETIGGEGTPAVAAFTAEPLATALQISTHAALSLMADALNLQHRLPRTWQAVEALEVPAWRARRLAQATATLSRAAAAHVDAELAERIASCGTATIDRLVAEAAAMFDPESQTDTETAAKANWDVRLSHATTTGGYAGTSWLDATGDTLDLTRFHDLICATAHELSTHGDTDTLQARKAKAIGLITDRALGIAPSSSASTRAGTTQAGTGAKTHLYLHIHATDLNHDSAGAGGVGRVERLGPATVARIKEWVGHSRVTVTPVLTPDHPVGAVDAHDPPARMREAVVLRDPHCVFPWCQRDSRSCDLDHIEAYDEHGPPGQTHPDNLAPLCRRHHRAKTTGRWRYTRNADATHTWQSPHARTYLVTPTGTHTIG